MDSPSASNIFGMSRYFSATSKALFRLVTGSSCGEVSKRNRKKSVRGKMQKQKGTRAGLVGRESGEGVGLERVL